MKKLTLITGASRGIGRETAKLFAEMGHDLILVCQKNTELLQQLSEELKECYGTFCINITADVGNYEEAERIFKELSVCGKQYPDVIVNNAGISYIGLFTDMTPEEWKHMLAVNLGSVLNICHLFTPGMILRQRGRIINVSSVWGNTGASCEAVYSASKGAVNSFTKALAKELAPSHITVNAAAFGAIDTQMNEFLLEEEKEALVQEIPLCRMGTAREAAQLIYALSEAPEYLTGQVVTMDGGWM